MRFYFLSVFLVLINVADAQLSAEPGIIAHCIEKEPEYAHGKEAMIKLFADSFNTPSVFACLNFECRIVVSYCIDTSGQLQSLQIVKGFHPALDEEVLRVMKLLNRWHPGTRGGKKAVFCQRQRFWFQFPFDDML
jgi:Gram-negative bacterial TonB protein C-terminal